MVADSTTLTVMARLRAVRVCAGITLALALVVALALVFGQRCLAQWLVIWPIFCLGNALGLAVGDAAG